MKLRHPGFVRLLGFLAAWVIRLWTRTLCIHVYAEDGGQHPADHRRHRYLYSFWHETILGVTAFPTRIHFLISQHFDGEVIAQICRHIRIDTIRGSTTRGGTQALLEMMHAKEGHLGVTPDGPRGPRRKVQIGMIFLASLTGLPIIPVGMAFGSAWRLPSWDRFAVPCPWSAMNCVLGLPIQVPARLNRDSLERYRRLVESEMERVTAMAEHQVGRRRKLRESSNSASDTTVNRPAA